MKNEQVYEAGGYDISYELCKRHNRSTNFVECEKCKDRFVCWTRRTNLNIKDTPSPMRVTGLYNCMVVYKGM